MSGPETIKAAFDSLLALLASARDDAGHDPIGGRCLSIAITHTENAELWAAKAYNGEQARAEGAALGSEADLSDVEPVDDHTEVYSDEQIETVDVSEDPE